MSNLILASASPRRKQILTDLGVAFDICSADIDESLLPLESGADYVSRLALEKCQKVFQLSDGAMAVLGSDTSVVIGGKILGKPESERQAIEMLMSLSGQWHEVVTGVAIVDRDKIKQVLVSSAVEFCELEPQMCSAYWRTGEPQDKAGSYAVQGKGARFVKQIRGSYSAIVGLPVVETAGLLDQFGIPYWTFKDKL
jgi:septum formation protein